MKRQARLAKYEYRRKRKRFFHKILVLFLLFLITLLVLNKIGFFNVTEIKVEGNDKLKKTEIIKASGLDVGKNYFSISPGDRIQDIEKIPMVKTAKVKLNWKREAVITVEERIPKFQVENFLEYYVLDEDLRIIAVENQEEKIPKIEDNFKKLTLGDFLYKDQKTLDFFKRLCKEPIYKEIESVNLATKDKYMVTNNDVQIIMGDFENLDYKFKMLDEILMDIEATGKNAKRIEMDKDDPIVMVDEQDNSEDEENSTKKDTVQSQ